MFRSVWIASWVALCVILVPASRGQEPPARPKTRVEFRWLENQYVKGVTEIRGIQLTCGPERVYPLKTSVLTSTDVAAARLCRADFSCSGLPGELYMVTFQFTEQAKKKLVAECGDAEARWLVVLVDGQDQGARVFRKAEAAGFVAQAGFLTSRTQAERIVAACK